MDENGLEVSEKQRTAPDETNGEPHGTFIYDAAFKSEGRYLKGIELSMEVEGETKVRVTDTITTKPEQNWHTSFQYVPQTSGTKTLIFSYGENTKEIVLEVA